MEGVEGLITRNIFTLFYCITKHTPYIITVQGHKLQGIACICACESLVFCLWALELNLIISEEST